MADPWTFGWDSLVAIGTLALAFVTVVLGIVAVRGNRLARGGLAVAQAELKASTLPILEAVPIQTGDQRRRLSPDSIDYANVGGAGEVRWAYRDQLDIFGTGNGVFVSIPVQNVGQGVARIERPRALSVPDVLWTEGESTRAMIPTREHARLHFRLAGVRDEVYAEVLYSDIGGEQRTRARFYIKREADESGHSTYAVRGTGLYHAGDDAPFAISGDANVAEAQPTLRSGVAPSLDSGSSAL